MNLKDMVGADLYRRGIMAVAPNIVGPLHKHCVKVQTVKLRVYILIVNSEWFKIGLC